MIDVTVTTNMTPRVMGLNIANAPSAYRKPVTPLSVTCDFVYIGFSTVACDPFL